MTIKNIKYNIHQKLSTVFPHFFKEKAFLSLKDALDPKSQAQPSENELYILNLFLDSRSSVIDVGANNGLYCYYFQEITKCRQIYAFEPIPGLYSKLKKWFKNIHIYPYAISNESTEKTLRIPYINSVKFETRAKLDNLLENNENHYDEIKVQTKTLDSLFLPVKDKIDFIKIDIEGHELNAVKGAQQLIERDHPVLMIEIEGRHHKDNFTAVIDTIKDLGYDCYFFDKQHYKMEMFQNFDLALHQDQSNPVYINNFLFFPRDSFSVEALNSKIKQTFAL